MTSGIVALLGAESTGKTTLAAALADRLRAQGREAVVVPEYLRAFCEAAGRTPRREEQAGIAAEQWRRIEAAAATGRIVLADTTPLMIAVYSDIVFGDTSFYDGAMALQARCTVTLLTGLDLPWQADGFMRDGAHVRVPVDARIRAALDRAGLPYAVVYGQGATRSAHALAALRPVFDLSPPEPPALTDTSATRLRLRCRECLQPTCEHLRLIPDAS